MNNNIFNPANILLPGIKADSPMWERWAIIACDQFTSEPEYWENVKEMVGGSPSTLNMILPKRTLRFNSTTPKTLADYAGAYVQDIWFGKYTSRGRLLGYIRNNLPVSFLWAYNNLYPVAKIEGKTYEAVEKISSASISQLPANANTASAMTMRIMCLSRSNRKITITTGETTISTPLIAVQRPAISGAACTNIPNPRIPRRLKGIMRVQATPISKPV